MADSFILHSFSAGELAPSLLARTDLAKYRSGASLMRNFFVDYRSGASTRNGLEAINRVKYQDGRKTRLIAFQFSVEVNYIIEFGDHYCRFYFLGRTVLETQMSITAISLTNPVTITVPGHTYSVGDWIFIQNAQGTLAIDNRHYIVSAVAGDVLTLTDTLGGAVNATTYGAYTGGGTAGKVYEIASPYAHTDLHLLKFAQLKNVMTLVHPSYPPTTLTALGPTNWSFATITFGSSIGPPPGFLSAYATGSPNTWYYGYVVTSVDSKNQESTWSPMAHINGAINISATAGSIVLAWEDVPGAASYNVYKASIQYGVGVPDQALCGFISNIKDDPSLDTITFTDSNIAPDFSQTPPVTKNPFAGGNNPSCTCFFQQRAYYAASTNFPTTFWASQPGFYNNFNESDPIVDSDAITGTLVSLQLNTIKAMLPMPGGLVFLTSGGAWQLSSGSGGLAATAAVTPSNATATPQAYNGCSDIPPIVVNYDVLYVQSKGSIVRDLSYNIYANIYTGSDVSIASNHLFFGYQIVEWAYCEEPFKIIWAVRDDGTLLSLTFLREQEIIGWAHHDTQGYFLSTASCREYDHDAPYFIVKRMMYNQWVTSIERMADRTFKYGAEDAFSLDCALRSNLPTPAADISGSSTQGVVQFTASAPTFAADNIGNVLRMNGGIAVIYEYVSPTIVNGTWKRPVPGLDAVDGSIAENTPTIAKSGDWSYAKPFTTFYGLDYMEGIQVNIVADGIVLNSQGVVGGKITLPFPATKVLVGFSYVCQLQSMYLDTGEPTIQGKRKSIPRVTIRAKETRGIKVGRDFKNMSPIKQWNDTVPINQAIPLLTGDAYYTMPPLWDIQGQIAIQQDEPMPATILGLIPEIVIGDTTGGVKTAK